MRRMTEMRSKGEDVRYEDVLHNLQERDYIDSHRKASPLAMAEDAVVLDNSRMTPEDQMVWLRDIMRKKFNLTDED